MSNKHCEHCGSVTPHFHIPADCLKAVRLERDKLRSQLTAFTEEIARLKDVLKWAGVTEHTPDPSPVSGVLEQVEKALEAAEGHLAESLQDKTMHPIGHCPVLDLVRSALSSLRGLMGRQG